ncbi:MAG: FlgD immunoglobulin-like domain containing protein [Candidatus Krumholzibacteria bacterium]|nr:FlgD immunoglobulin-like domain containing protein [Candidatus Krumholzibacteria bacterium]MDP6796388.1 FlgD immunoglobulin-like domain containing protein [Candidatus Krumholzibacteria bacterium]
MSLNRKQGFSKRIIRIAWILATTALLLAMPEPLLARSANVFLGRDIAGHEEELSRYDLLVLSPSTLNRLASLEEIRSHNPEIRIFLIFDFFSGQTGNFNELSLFFSSGIREEWIMRSTTDAVVSSWPETFVNNLTEHCLEVEGRVYRDYALDFFENELLPRLTHYDGLFLDQCFESAYYIHGRFDGDFDMNLDGLSDTREECDEWIRDGWLALLKGIRERAPELPIIGNGNNRFFGQLDGRMFENFPNTSFGGVLGALSKLEGWRDNSGGQESIINCISTEEDAVTRRASWALERFTGQHLSFDYGSSGHDELLWSDLHEISLGEASGRLSLNGEHLAERTFDSSEELNGVFFPAEGRWLGEEEDPLVGSGSLEINAMKKGWQALFATDLSPVESLEAMVVAYRYRVIRAPKQGVKIDAAFRRHGDNSAKVSLPCEKVKTGDTGFYLARSKGELNAHDDWYFYLSSEDPCKIVVDEIQVVRENTARMERVFEEGVVLLSLSSEPITLDNWEHLVPSPADCFADSWSDDRGSWILEAGETLLLLEGDGGPLSSENLRTESEKGKADFSLQAPFPNPFNPKVSIPFALSESTLMRVAIYDARGRRVRELTNRVYSAGEHRLDWTGRDDAGRRVPSGVYFLKMESGREVQKRKLVLTS